MHAVTLFQAVRTLLDTGPVALATVVEVDGSVPRRPGAMMAIGRRAAAAPCPAPMAAGPGDTVEVGTVGGGAMEGRILQAMQRRVAGAHDVPVAVPAPETLTIDLHGTPDDVRDGICGGTMRVDVRTLDGDDRRAIDALLRAGEDGRAALLSADGDGLAVGLLDTAGDAPASDGATAAFVATADGWTLPVVPRRLVLVVGGGHCGVALARQLLDLEFDVIVEDDRDDVRERLAASLPPAVRIAAGPTADTLERLAGGRPVHAALVTRSFRQDVDALDALHRRGAASIGVMGSRRRLGTVLGLLRERGWTAAATDALDAPIGVDLAAESPAEIAVSIAAQLIEHRAAGVVRFAPSS